MPREVHLEPSGSPFVHSTPFNHQLALNDISMMDSSLTELSDQYFHDNDNLNSSNALAGLADVTVGMADDISVMKLQTSESDEMLLGVKGEEFLADDSAMGFDTPSLFNSTRARSKSNQPATFPPSIAKEAITETEQEPIKVEKPKRKKSTRSRSSSPSKKNSVSEPVLEDATVFPQTRMKTMTEEPEPEPEPEPKLRRSPRKTRTRPPSTVEPSLAFSTTSSNAFPFITSSTRTTSEPTSTPESITHPEPEPSAEPQTAPTTKPKRTSRVVGRSKSKSRSKSTRVEEPLDGIDSPRTEQECAAPPEEDIHSDAQPATSPAAAADPSPTPAQEPAPMATPVDDGIYSEAPAVRRSLATAQRVELKPYPIRTEPGSSPFKFQLPPSLARSRTQSATPTFTGTLKSASAISPNSTLPSLDTPKDNCISEQEAQKATKEPTKEEEAEAIAAAMRILRRDSLVFAHSHQSFPSNLNEPLQSYADPSLVPGKPEEALASQQAAGESTPAEAVPRRTRVGRKSTRVKGGAGVAVTGRAAGKNESAAQDTQEREQQSTEEITSAPMVFIGERLTNVEANSQAIEGLNAGQEAPEQTQDTSEKEQQDIVVPVNFGSGPSSPTSALVESPTPPILPQAVVHQASRTVAPPESGTGCIEPSIPSAPEPKSTLSKKSKTSSLTPVGRDVPIKTRATRASMPAQVSHISPPARVTRSIRRSEARPTISRDDSAIGTNKPKELVVEQDTAQDAEKLTDGCGNGDLVEDVSIQTRTNPPDGIVLTPVDSPAALTAPVPAPEEIPKQILQDGSDRPSREHEPVIEREPVISQAATRQKVLGAKKAPQRVMPGAPLRAASTTSQPSTSGLLQPRRAVSSASSNSGPPTVPTHRTTSATHKPASVPAPTRITPSALPKQSELTDDSTPTSSATPSVLQQTAISSHKPPSSSSDTAASAASVPGESGSPDRVGSPKDVTGQDESTVSGVEKQPPLASSRLVSENEDADASEDGVRAVRALPKRASRFSKVATIPEDSMEVSGADSREIRRVEQTGDANTVIESTAPGSLQMGATGSNSIWPREPAPNPFALVGALPESESRITKSIKRRVSSPESEPEANANDSPSKRVRFSAVLEAGPTPGIGRALRMPKPSLKVKKPKFERKANRPKRVLTRDWVVGGTHSYAAPLKRNIDGKENSRATTEKARGPLSESQTNTRATMNKLKPTMPVAFTFRSEMRLKPYIEQPHPAAIPIANPMPDFASAHAAAEAANLARRQRAQEALLAAQAELEGYRSSKYAIGSETARRAAERAVFDAAIKVKEAEAERIRVEQRRLEAEKEAVDIKKMRKKMVPKANPVPEFYRSLARCDAKDVEA